MADVTIANVHKMFGGVHAVNDVSLHIYDRLYHELFNEREPDRSRVLGDLTGWLERLLNG